MLVVKVGAVLALCSAAVGAAAVPPMTSADDVIDIQQTLGLFPLSIDLKRFDLLSGVFAENATANFTGHSVASGLPAIRKYLEKGLASVTSQHDLGTLYVNKSGPATATSYNYIHGTFFGKGSAANKSCSYFGYYLDDLVKHRGGSWLVQNRVLGTFGVYGDQSLLAPLLNG